MSIKKYVVPLAVLACAILMPVKGFAFTSVTKSTQTALVTFIGAGSATLIVTPSNGAGNPILWTSPTAGSGWVDAGNYLVVNSTVTSFGGGVQIYTDNANSVPAWSGTVVCTPATCGSTVGVSTNNPAGLVCSSATTTTLPIAWSATPSTWTVTAAVEPNLCTGGNAIACQWNYMEDDYTPNVPTTSTSGFVNGADYVLLYKAGAGLHYDSGSTGFFPNNTPGAFNVFLEANFANALTATGGITYKTTTLRLESFTQ